MIVSDILKSKASNSVVTTTGEHTIADAVQLLYKWRIGALVVLDDAQHICGILSERDIVRRLAVEGPRILSFKVSELMTRNVLVCAPADMLEAVERTMTDHRIRHLPVIRESELAGIITIGDVVKWRLAEATMQVDQMREYVMLAH